MPVKRIMLVVRQLAHSIKLKEALERSGSFLSSAFADPEDALAELARAPYDLILLDCTINGLSIENFVEQARQTRPAIAIIVAPNHPLVRGLRESLRLQAVIDLPIAARQLIPLIQSILTDPVPSVSAPHKLSAASLSPPAPSVEDEAEAQRRDEQSSRLFERLAAAEPPIPPFEESVTVRDVVVSLSSTQPTRVFTSQDEADDEETTSTLPSLASRQLLANHILQEALETASAPTPPQGFSLAKFIQRVQERLQEGQALVKPLPSWIDDSGRYVREPEFLPDLPPLDGPPSTYTASQTYVRPDEGQAQAPVDLAQQPTDRIEPIPRSTPAPADDASAADPAPRIHPLKPRPQPESEQPKAAEEAVAPLPVDLSSTTLTPTRQDALLAEALAAALRADQARAEQSEQEPPPQSVQATEVTAPQQEEALLAPPSVPDEALAQVDSVRYAQALSAQVALALTDLSLETVVEACLLVREGQIVGSSGILSAALLEEIKPHALEPLEDGTAARMTPIELTSGAFYMLYAIRTVDAFTLVLLFAGQQTVSTIRHHARLLHEVLASVPPPLIVAPPNPIQSVEAEPVAQAEAGEQDDSQLNVVTVAPLAFVWLLHPNQPPLRDAEMQAILRSLEVHLTKQGWLIHDLNVYRDVVSLYASAPSETPPVAHMRALLSLSAQAVAAVSPDRLADSLWDRSYWIVTPGRPISTDELRDFIAFARP
ncbi:MAG: hypothetical protein NZ750_13565 [Anaerolineae bacterium]|nr:hypothetical protein [Anaerolineae bacterium]MDW8172827.1 hypothetical protein [Anaerolineae bacterium]